jgi:hypothetical protein
MWLFAASCSKPLLHYRSKNAGAISRITLFLPLMGQKKQINARVPDNLHGLILERANLIEETQGGYLGLIAQWWFAQGHPPVNEYEARLLSQKKPRESAK